MCDPGPKEMIISGLNPRNLKRFGSDQIGGPDPRRFHPLIFEPCSVKAQERFMATRVANYRC